jgi:hypothetical protein
MTDSTLSQCGEPGAIPSPPSGSVEVMYVCTSRIRSAGHSGVASRSSAVRSWLFGRPHRKSECLHQMQNNRSEDEPFGQS